MVSMEEFIGYTKSSEFGDDEPWDSVVDDAPFQPDELDKFEVSLTTLARRLL